MTVSGTTPTGQGQRQDDWRSGVGSGASPRKWEGGLLKLKERLPVLLSSLHQREGRHRLLPAKAPSKPSCPDAVELSQGFRASDRPSKDKSHQRGPTNCEVTKYQDLGDSGRRKRRRCQFPRPSWARMGWGAAVAPMSMCFLLAGGCFYQALPCWMPLVTATGE